MKLFVILLLPLVAHAQWVPLQENPGLFEGDMILSPDQKAEIDQGIYRYATKKSGLWPKSGQYVYVPYEIDSGNSDARGAVEKAARDYEQYTCIRLRPRRGERAYLRFYAGGGCSSPVGYRGGQNSISLPRGCRRHGTVLHEIAHSLGVYHEQSRPDRDNYVTVVWDNLKHAQHNFKKQSYSVVDSLGTPYDYRSMMHYSGTAFGSGKITLRTKDRSMQDIIGQRTGFSDIDKIQLNKLYRCNGGGGPNPTKRPPPTRNPPPTDCKDRVVDCAKNSRNCKSTWPAWRDYMRKYCRRTCNFC